MPHQSTGKTRELYSHENLGSVENANSIRMDDLYVYSLSGKAYPRLTPRDRNHVRERRLPFIKRATAKGRVYHYFVAPGREILGKLPNPDAIDFDNAYLRFLALLEGETVPDYQHPVKSAVYFIGCDQAIKIGVAKDVQRRFAAIQMCSPLPLRLLATVDGTRALERAYHTRFADHRLHGEWFAPHPDILAEIARLTTRQGGENG